MSISKSVLTSSCALALGVLFSVAVTAPTLARSPRVIIPDTQMRPDVPPMPDNPTLPAQAVEAATAYASYMDHAASFTGRFENGEHVTSQLRDAEAFEVNQMQQGEVAYVAMLALQDPNFVAEVRKLGQDPTARETVVGYLMGNPAYVGTIPGAPNTATMITATLASQGAKVRAAGKLVKQAAYDVQHQAWSRGVIPNREGRLAEAKALSVAPMHPSPEDAARVLQVSTNYRMASSTDATPAPAAQPPYPQVVQRGMALAALAVLGRGGENHATQVAPLLVNHQDAFCLNMSKLNLYQCLAVAKPYFEDIFCLGQHVLIDTGECVMKSAGALAAVEPEAAPPPAAPKPVAARRPAAAHHAAPAHRRRK